MLKWFKLAAVTTAFAFGAMMTGCSEDNPLDPDPSFEITLGTSDTIQAGTEGPIIGKIETNLTIASVEW